jgi:hypothetical protein
MIMGEEFRSRPTGSTKRIRFALIRERERGGESQIEDLASAPLLSSPSDCELISSSSPSLNARHSPCSAKRGDHSAQSWNSVLGQSKSDERSPQEIRRLQGLRGWIRGLPSNARCLHPQDSAHGKEKCKSGKWNGSWSETTGADRLHNLSSDLSISR